MHLSTGPNLALLHKRGVYAYLGWPDLMVARYRCDRRKRTTTYVGMDELLWTFVLHKEEKGEDSEALREVKAVLAKHVARELFERQQMRDVAQA